MKIKDRWIESAIQAITLTRIADEKGIHASEYKGYISAFGASVIQSGLLPAVIFYENSEGNQDKGLLIKAIVVVLNEVGEYKIDAQQNFSQFVRVFHNEEKLLKDVSHAAMALKLALMTFKSEDND